MRRSDTGILTSHVGSLPRPDSLIEANRKRLANENMGEASFQTLLADAVVDVVRRQLAGWTGEGRSQAPRSPRRGCG